MNAMLSYSHISLLLFLPIQTYQNVGTSSYETDLPLIIAHRGESVLLPEHTIPAYEFAMEEEADFIEPDLVMTKDFVFVCYHDLRLACGTDVRMRPEFDHLHITERNISYDGETYTIKDDWLVSDFTLEQIKRLRKIQHKIGNRPRYFDRLFPVPTFDEFMKAVQKFTFKSASNPGRRSRKTVGIMPELKHPSYYNALAGTSNFMENQFIQKLETNGYAVKKPDGISPEKRKVSRCSYNGTVIPCNPVIVQCWEPSTIEYLSETTTLRLLTVLYTNNIPYLTYRGLATLAGKTEFVSLYKELLFTGPEAEVAFANVSYNKKEVEQLGGFIHPGKMVDYAHELGMKVSIYTISSSWENSRRGCAKKCTKDSKREELEYFFSLGVKAIFVEGIGESLRIRDEYFRKFRETEKEQKTRWLLILLLTLLFIIATRQLV
ncbi:unnamed protein product [Orchesella dallaii]|uniref:glycerophosphodiester phosphodiesterase n=1 Tax=Orchesella dallaii TaxID=48710 RepID=A0ABP1S8M1_9HEXA